MMLISRTSREFESLKICLFLYLGADAIALPLNRPRTAPEIVLIENFFGLKLSELIYSNHLLAMSIYIFMRLWLLDQHCPVCHHLFSITFLKICLSP